MREKGKNNCSLVIIHRVSSTPSASHLSTVDSSGKYQSSKTLLQGSLKW